MLISDWSNVLDCEGRSECGAPVPHSKMEARSSRSAQHAYILSIIKTSKTTYPCSSTVPALVPLPAMFAYPWSSTVPALVPPPAMFAHPPFEFQVPCLTCFCSSLVGSLLALAHLLFSSSSASSLPLRLLTRFLFFFFSLLFALILLSHSRFLFHSELL